MVRVEVHLHDVHPPRWEAATRGQTRAWHNRFGDDGNGGVTGEYETRVEYITQGSPGAFYIRRLRPGSPWREIRESSTPEVLTDSGSWKQATSQQTSAWENRFGPDGHGGRTGAYETRVHYEGQGNAVKFELRRVDPAPPGRWREIRAGTPMRALFVDMCSTRMLSAML